MLSKKEMTIVALAIVLMTLVISFSKGELKIEKVLLYFLFSLIILLLSVFAKKIIARVINVEIEQNFWQWQRYGLAKRSYFKRPIPLGLILPAFLSIISLGAIKAFCFLQFTAKALPSKVVKKYGAKRFSGIMEWDDALIVFYSVIPLLALALLSRIIALSETIELSKITIYYVIWNLIPISNLDGTKLFFGSRPLFIFTWILALISTLIVLF